MEIIEVITSVQRRRCWTLADKLRAVEELNVPGMTVSYDARKYAIGVDLATCMGVQAPRLETLRSTAYRKMGLQGNPWVDFADSWRIVPTYPPRRTSMVWIGTTYAAVDKSTLAN